MLRIFCTAAESRNFKEAATRLGVSPQAVTRAVKDLEDHVGELLFHRNTRHNRITEFGEQLAVRARHSLQGVDAIFQGAEQAAEVQPIFITIDPARDTASRVGEFTAAFSPRLIGLTGSQAEIDVAVKAFKVVAARGANTPGGYLMDHSRMAYLMGRNGEPIASLPVDLGIANGPAAVADDLAKLVK